MDELIDQKRLKELGSLTTDPVQEMKKKEKEAMEAVEKHQLAVQQLDKALAEVDFKVTFHIDQLSVEMTGNKSDYFGNSKLVSLGFENQGFFVQKLRQEIQVNFFGVTVGTYNRFEELYKFIMRTKNTVTQVTSQLQSEMKDEQYLNDLKLAIERSKGLVVQGSKSDNGGSDLDRSQLHQNDF
mmetsp:Transcript_8327/g.13927  ORF Transcript_8327/g.13927 Transcript_8327/m.13927 type:complete len:183 (-) Transcript_8327:602-1150(-)